MSRVNIYVYGLLSIRLPNVLLNIVPFINYILQPALYHN